MKIKSLIIGTIFILGQVLTQYCLFDLVFVNTDWGAGGLGAGYAMTTAAALGFVSFFCGGFLTSSNFYKTTFARLTFSLVIPLFFLFMLTIERMYGLIVDNQSAGSPNHIPTMYVSITLACWLILQMTYKKR